MAFTELFWRQLPPSLRQDTRARVLLLSLNIPLAFGGPVALARILAGTPWTEAALVGVASLIAFASFALLWINQSVVASGVLLYVAMAVAFPIAAVFGDGVAVMMLPCVVFIPIAARYVLGRIAGDHAALTLTTVMVLLSIGAAANGISLPTPPAGQIDELLSFTGIIALLWMVYGVVSIFDRAHESSLAALQASEARYALAIRAEDSGVVEWTEGGALCFATARACALLGLRGSDQSEWSALLAHIHDVDAVALSDALRAAQERVGSSFHVETSIPLVGHPPRRLVWDGLAEEGADGKRRVVAVVRDVTEDRRLAALKDDFIANMNHELRTPLTSIVGALGLLRAGVGATYTADGKFLLDVATKNGERLTALIDDLLDVQRLELGVLPLATTQLELSSIAHSVVTELAGYARARGVRLRLLAAESVWIEADPRRCRQILHNLVHNACKFSPPRSLVEVRVSGDAGIGRIEVQDHGPGIAPEFHSHVFERFSQAWSGANRPQGGTGLGLALAQGLTEKMNGEIGFRSDVGEGACFWLSFPTSAAAK